MKRFSFLLPILLFFIAMGCDKDHKSSYAYFSSSDISVYSDTTSYYVTIYATNVNWWKVTKDSDSDWLTVNGDVEGTGNNKGLMLLSFPINTDTLDREATFTLQYQVDTVTTTKMTFTQLAQSKLINVNLDTLFISSAAQVANVDVDANVDWSADFDWNTMFDVSWARPLNNGLTKLMVENTLRVEVDENMSSNFRIANVNIRQPSMNVDTMVVLYQAGKGTLESDKAVLTKLYSEMGGANWTKTWDLSAPVESWYGVSVANRRGEQRVVALNLADNNLEGTIPASVSELSYLEMLALQNNKLSGEIPQEISYLYELRYLYLLENSLVGEIPAELFKIPKIERIHLGSNQLTGEIPEEIGDPTTLKVFGADNNNLTGTLPLSLASTKTLESIMVQGNRMSGEIPAAYFSNDLWMDWDYPKNIAPQQSGYGFSNIK